MIKLTKSACPDVLADRAAEWTDNWVRHVVNSAPIAAADASRYRHPDIKAAVIAETHEKCAYCESKIRHVSYGDVEHILPKKKKPALFVDWQNLTFCCSICNGAKSDYFSDTEPLLNPYVDDPSQHLKFHGPIVFHLPGSAIGEMSIAILQLSRAELIERRAERIRSLKVLIDRWQREAGTSLKSILLDAIRKELADDHEYAATLRDFALAHASIQT